MRGLLMPPHFLSSPSIGRWLTVLVRWTVATTPGSLERWAGLVCASVAGRRLLGLLTNLTDAHSALSNELTQTPTDHNRRRMNVDGGAAQWGAGGAVGPNETDNSKQHSNAVPDDDGGAKKRRHVDISHPAAGGGGDGGGHSGGGSIGAGGAAAATQQQHEGGSSSLSAGLLTAPNQQPNQQQQKQHPLEYIFVGRRTFFLLSLNDILRLRATCKWARGLFGAPQLRQRLSHSLSTQAGLRRTVNENVVQLLTFADQQMGERDLLAALCVTEAGGWSEMSEVIELAGQCGCCQLPVTLNSGDLHQYPNKTAYLDDPRVLAQLKMVGPHIRFGDGVTFQLFRHGYRLRAIKDQYGFELTINPPLPPNHPYQQHRQPHDPPVSSSIDNYPSRGWLRWASVSDYTSASPNFSSVSSCVKKIVLNHFEKTHQINSTYRMIDRHVDNSRLHTLITQSPHTPVERCTTTMSYHLIPGRHLVLTDASQSFVAWIRIDDFANYVKVEVCTTEPAVSVGGAFKVLFPQTTRLARAVLETIISAMIFDQ
ncbi:unnamed protein product [Vitrella brassicaformis CCMP3155]|uniref:Uncharacterized protein n=1 Tax=Vitrella brassicaformis (strain CCMP3155) TaxID=1169540 RepID=A0A0G4FIV3_VITBC|nr:unnamed protein product [Vitrella brassicaformis CCMP3155]|eukprot:CEM13605.1 unnamed protein product [Vitrella brassicaformis CCMP3155]